LRGKISATNYNKVILFLLIHPIIIFSYLANFIANPIRHLFVDDWVIFKDFSLDNYGFNSQNQTSYNGHHLFFTRVLFIFVTETLRLDIATMAFILFILYVIILYIFAFKITHNFNNRNLARFGIVIIGLNLNQYQNFVMPICWPWIISLIIFYLAFIILMSDQNIPKHLVLVTFIMVSPQISGLGNILPIGILLISLHSTLKDGPTGKKVGLIISSALSMISSYGLTAKSSENTYEQIVGFNSLINNPRGALTFILSSFGAPFAPASRYSTYISTICGGLILALLLYVFRSSIIYGLPQTKILILCGLVFHALQFAARYNGSEQSIVIVNQPRYTSGALILIIGLFLASLSRNLNKFNVSVVFVMLAIMSISGFKTSWDFAQIRGNASNQISICIDKNGFQNQLCLKMLDPGSKILDANKFSEAVEYLYNRN
jgi:hypothetical protein